MEGDNEIWKIPCPVTVVPHVGNAISLAANPRCGGTKLLFWPIYPKNCMKMKIIEPKSLGAANGNSQLQQECILVGCVPPARYRMGGGSLSRGSL